MAEFTEEIREHIAHFGEQFAQDTIEEHYDEISPHYEKMMTTMGHPDPDVIANMALDLLGDLSDKSALDMGCGTGMVGNSLKKLNCHEILGIDASQGMLDIAKEKNCYDQLIYMFLGKPKEYPPKYRDRFDLVTGAAVLAEGHLGIELFDEMIHSLKRGGYAIFTTREMYLDKYGYRVAIDELVRRGFWKKAAELKF